MSAAAIPRGFRGPRAFTLIELLVVVTLIGILTAMILPEMRGTRADAVLRSAGRRLVSACGVASSQAISRGETHRVRFDPANGRYRLERRSSPPGGNNAPAFSPVEGIADATGSVDSRITLEVRRSPAAPSASPSAAAPETDSLEDERAPAPRGHVGFYPDGTADRADIILRDREGFGLILRVNPVTGRVRVLAMPRR